MKHSNRFGQLSLLGGLALVTMMLASAKQAQAQATGFSLDRAQISGDPDDYFNVNRAAVADDARFYTTGTLGYTYDTLRARNITSDGNVQDQYGSILENQLIAYVGGGIEFAKMFSVQLMLPIAIFQTTGMDSTDPFYSTYGYGVSSGAVYDLRLDMRWKAYESDDRTFKFGLGTSIFFPTGNVQQLTSDGSIGALPYAMLEKDFGSFLLAGTLGADFRSGGTLGNGGNGALYVGNELRLNIGAYVPIPQTPLKLGLEIWGGTGIESLNGNSTFFRGQNTFFEWTGIARYELGEKKQGWLQGGLGTRFTEGYGAASFRALAQFGWYWPIKDIEIDSTAGVKVHESYEINEEVDTDGDGYPDYIDLCPTVKEDGENPNPTDGCPKGYDRDGDGIPDEIDKCPDVPEDKDGIQDEDGCPEEDADSDGILDVNDKCPEEAGVPSADPARFGCPASKKNKIVEEDGEIRLLEPIQFATGKSDILPVSFPILDEVVEVMTERPELRLGVYGHTDNRGEKWYNLNLSKSRAKAVMDYLVAHSIERKRLESDGFGPDRPVTTNDTDEGRAKNRRVEFKILK